MRNYYSILDSVADEFSPFFLAKNDKVAVRSYVQTLRGLPSVGLDELHLYHVCVFDDSSDLKLPEHLRGEFVMRKVDVRAVGKELGLNFYGSDSKEEAEK